jgi:DNA-directed RNA polymerase subunit beta'
MATESHDTNPGVRLRLLPARAADVRQWTTGTVRTDEMFCGEKRLIPAEAGLFCPEHFGRLNDRDWSCSCGTVTTHVAPSGELCSRCGLPPLRGRSQLRRLARIDLAVPVLHVWYLRGPTSPGPAALLLGLTQKELEDIVYCRRYIVLLPGSSGQARCPLITAAEADRLCIDRPPPVNQSAADAEPLTGAEPGNSDPEPCSLLAPEADLSRVEPPTLVNRFVGGAELLTGAEAVARLLARLDLAAVAGRRPDTGDSLAARRCRLAEGLLRADIDPSSLVLRQLPVLPPELRPATDLPSGKRSLHPLNELYTRVLARNIRVAEVRDAPPEKRRSPAVIRKRVRALQCAVEALLDSRSALEPLRDRHHRPLPGLADLLRGKPGLFRGQLLGKRVDYSARAVIVSGPELHLDQVGLPRAIARVLFRPFLVRSLRRTIRHLTGFDPRPAARLAERILDGEVEVVDDLLRDAGPAYRSFRARAARALLAASDLVDQLLDLIAPTRWVLINRAPTLHRLGVQAFRPVLTSGRAVRLHPLTCAGFGADFDGDTVAVHAPIADDANSASARLEPSACFLSPANGKPAYPPSQEMLLGMYYLTWAPADPGPPRLTADVEEVLRVFEGGTPTPDDPRRRPILAVHDPVQVRLPAGKAGSRPTRISTTVGRVLFNNALPADTPFHNETVTRGRLAAIVSSCFDPLAPARAAETVDRLMRLGFQWATRAGISLAPGHFPTRDDDLAELVAQADTGTPQQIQRAWSRLDKSLRDWLQRQVRCLPSLADPADQVPPDLAGVRIMLDSGALKKVDSIRQIAAPRGLMSHGSGSDPIPEPIRSGLREGMSPREFFISSFGARKAGFDKGRPLRDSGYFTRQLIFALQQFVITEMDCGSRSDIYIPWAEAAGRPASLCPIQTSSRTGPPARGFPRRIPLGGIRVQRFCRVRSPLTCRAPQGICCACYGNDPSTRLPVRIGTPVGIIAAGSLGEPGSQLAMKTKHEGGVASGSGGLGPFVRLRKLLGGPGEGLPATGPARAAAIVEVFRGKGIDIDRRHVELAVAALCRGGPTGEDPPLVRRGIKAAACGSGSFLANAAFEQPELSLRAAVLEGLIDPLLGAQEREIVGLPIPSPRG